MSIVKFVSVSTFVKFKINQQFIYSTIDSIREKQYHYRSNLPFIYIYETCTRKFALILPQASHSRVFVFQFRSCRAYVKSNPAERGSAGKCTSLSLFHTNYASIQFLSYHAHIYSSIIHDALYAELKLNTLIFILTRFSLTNSFCEKYLHKMTFCIYQLGNELATEMKKRHITTSFVLQDKIDK